MTYASSRPRVCNTKTLATRHRFYGTAEVVQHVERMLYRKLHYGELRYSEEFFSGDDAISSGNMRNSVL